MPEIYIIYLYSSLTQIAVASVSILDKGHDEHNTLTHFQDKSRDIDMQS